ncbi:hypothetical protein O1611_g6788 [Lasiodiplodia mahajangana]|uniref:Uncharacterized protein n=1 Tax=Lasiodiplodia mahajangana TaxID=1108764 RepID=A0ACC2JHB8_9PEZI|nr:hypothetical protein O1611_g6788 [Lasiodiplodia mahajangana]
MEAPILGPMPDEGGSQSECGYGSEEIDIEFTDLLLTPRVSHHAHRCLMRQYQLLAAVNGRLGDGIEEAIQKVENNIEELLSQMKVRVMEGYTEKVVHRSLKPKLATRRIIRSTPIGTHDLHVILDYSSSQGATERLYRELILLNDTLSNLDKIPRDIAGKIKFPSTTVGWQLTAKDKDGSIEGSGDDWDDEAFFELNPMKQVPTKRLGQYRGIVKLEIHSRTEIGTLVRSYGTGWLLDRTTVVTSGHCVIGRMERMCSTQVTIGFGTDNPMTCRGTHVLPHWAWFRDFNTAHDLAVIRIDNGNDEAGLPWRTCPRTGGLDVFVMGYPSFKDPELMRKKLRNPNLQESRDELDCKVAVTKGLLKHEASTWNGSSGCPIFDNNGAIVAVHSGRRSLTSHHYNVAPVLDEDWNNVDKMKEALNGFVQWSSGTSAIKDDVIYGLDNNGASLFEMHNL